MFLVTLDTFGRVLRLRSGLSVSSGCSHRFNPRVDVHLSGLECGRLLGPVSVGLETCAVSLVTVGASSGDVSADPRIPTVLI